MDKNDNYALHAVVVKKPIDMKDAQSIAGWLEQLKLILDNTEDRLKRRDTIANFDEKFLWKKIISKIIFKCS